MTVEKQQFRDVSPIESGDVPLPCWFSGHLAVAVQFSD